MLISALMVLHICAKAYFTPSPYYLMKVYVGTSGWAYSWNRENSLGWYAKETGLNAIELNTSFYRYPSSSQVKTWAEEGKDLKWSVKVNQTITHRYKFNKNSYARFESFKRVFEPLDNKIKFYLFQLPPILTPNSLDKIVEFQDRFGLGERFALEVRNINWFDNEIYKRIKALGITMVSIDSPIGSFIVKTSKSIYLRMHGRVSWYSYKYKEKELFQIASKISQLAPTSSYIFFNNDHSMLQNARMMLGVQKR